MAYIDSVTSILLPQDKVIEFLDGLSDDALKKEATTEARSDTFSSIMKVRGGRGEGEEGGGRKRGEREQGFIQRGGGAGIPPLFPSFPLPLFPPCLPLEIEYGCYCFVACIKQQSCPRSNLRGSKFKFSWGSMPPDPPSRHAHLRMRERAFACYYHPAFPPPTQNPV